MNGRLTLRFVTPLRIQERGKYVGAIDFGVLLRNLLRRISMLAQIHCGIDCSGIDSDGLNRAADAVETIHSDLQWHDWERYSHRQKTRMKLGGLVGKITFAGDLSLFRPFILLGRHVHAGKNTSFGLGWYRMAHE